MKKIVVTTALTILAITLSLVTTLALFSNSHQEDSSHTSSVSTSTITSTPIPATAPSTTETPSPTSMLISNLTGIQLYTWQPPSDTSGSIVVIDSPANNAVYSTNDVTLTVHAGIQAPYVMVDVCLVTDWSNETRLFYNMNNGLVTTPGLTITTTLIGVPEGNHSITVIANSACGPFAASSSINFTIGTLQKP